MKNTGVDIGVQKILKIHCQRWRKQNRVICENELAKTGIYTESNLAGTPLHTHPPTPETVTILSYKSLLI